MLVKGLNNKLSFKLKEGFLINWLHFDLNVGHINPNYTPLKVSIKNPTTSTRET